MYVLGWVVRRDHDSSLTVVHSAFGDGAHSDFVRDLVPGPIITVRLNISGRQTLLCAVNAVSYLTRP